MEIVCACEIMHIEQTFRERTDLAQFRIKLFEMVRKWSIEYDSGPENILVRSTARARCCKIYSYQATE